MHILEKELYIDYPLEKVFEFLKNPKNLSLVTPPMMNFSLLTPDPIVMQQGAVFDYKIKIFGVPMRWTSYISDYEPPYRFVDIQLRGPHDYWHHQHILKNQVLEHLLKI